MDVDETEDVNFFGFFGINKVACFINLFLISSQETVAFLRNV